MSCLKKVIDAMETECSKSLTNIVLGSDGMGARFQSRFIFQLLAGSSLNKSLCWFFNGRHLDKGSRNGAGQTTTNILFQRVKSGQIMVYMPKESSDAAITFVPSIITMYLPRQDEIVEPESIHQAPSIPETLSILKFVRQVNNRVDCSIEFFQRAVNQEAFHTQ